MKITNAAVVTPAASNEPTFNADNAVDSAIWTMHTDAPIHAERLRQALSSNNPVAARIDQLPSMASPASTNQPTHVSVKKRVILGMSVLIGVAAVPMAIASLALGPMCIGIAAGCALAAVMLHKLANNMS